MLMNTPRSLGVPVGLSTPSTVKGSCSMRVGPDAMRRLKRIAATLSPVSRATVAPITAP